MQTLVISGDINSEEIKAWSIKYFGEIPSGTKHRKKRSCPRHSKSTADFIMRYFAKAPQLTMVFPSTERYSERFVCSQFLADLLQVQKNLLCILYW